MARSGSAFQFAAVTALLTSMAAGAIAQSPDTQSDDPSHYTCETVRCVSHFIGQHQCIALTDGCQIVARPSYDPGRFIKRGLIIPHGHDRPQTYLLLSLEPPLPDDAVAHWMTVSTCSKRHEFVCVKGSPPPFPSIEGPPPMGPDWISDIEVHESWVDLKSTDYRVGCLSLDPNLRRAYGTLPSRKLWARWSVCAAGDQRFLP